MATLTTVARNPFDLPELTHRCSRFFTIKDALSCALVSKGWADSFVPVIWFRIDFNTRPRFANLSSDIIAKHGHHIRIVLNAKSFFPITVLNNAAVNKLRVLHIDPTVSTEHHRRAIEVVSRNKASLKTLYFIATVLSLTKTDSPAHFVPSSAFVPCSGATGLTSISNFKSLKLDNMYLTQEDLVLILQGCPSLVELSLRQADIVSGNPKFTFQHTGVKNFHSTFGSVFPPLLGGPSQLSYFPNLEILTASNVSTKEPIDSVRIKEEIARYCPRLTGYRLWDDTGTIVSEVLTNVAQHTTEIVFRYKHLSQAIVDAVLLHRTTMKTVRQIGNHFRPSGFLLNDAKTARTEDQVRSSERLVQQILRSCPKLEHFDLSSHEMDMDEMEQGEWVCKDLTTFRVRIKGLGDKEMILKAIKLWRAGCWRRWQEKAGTIAAEELDRTDISIEARVARHLLKFDKLSSVSFGNVSWTPL